MIEVADKTAVITGASRGLGAGIAADFLARGMNIAVCARKAPAVAASERVISIAADVRDEAALTTLSERAIEKFGRIDIWINNAGVLGPVDMLREISSADYAEHLQINVLGVFHGSKIFTRHVRAREGGGVLINISSGAAQNAYEGWSAYCAGKAAVERMSQCLAMEERGTGLRVHSVAPGVIDTDMQATIRQTPSERFPMVGKFHQLKADEAFNTTDFVAEKLLELALLPVDPGVVIDLPRKGR